MGLRLQEFALMHQKLKVNILAFDYRGYGYSTGKPSQDGLIEDTEAVLRYLSTRANRGDVDASKVILFGRSLGGAVVAHVAGKENAYQSLGVKPAGVIICNSFTSIADLLDHLFPMLSFDWM